MKPDDIEAHALHIYFEEFQKAVTFVIRCCKILRPENFYGFRPLLTTTKDRQVDPPFDLKAQSKLLTATNLESAITMGFEIYDSHRALQKTYSKQLAVSLEKRREHFQKVLELRRNGQTKTPLFRREVQKWKEWSNTFYKYDKILNHHSWLNRKYRGALKANKKQEIDRLWHNLETLKKRGINFKGNVVRLHENVFNVIKPNGHYAIELKMFNNERRHLLELDGGNYQYKLLQAFAKSKNTKRANLCLDVVKGTYSLNYPLTRPRTAQSFLQPNIDYTFIGVDVGLTNLAVVCAVDGATKKVLKVQFFSGKEAGWKRAHWAHHRRVFQRKGYISRGAKPKRKPFQDREHQYMETLNHTISKRIIEFAKQFPNPLLVLEDLKYIRFTTKAQGRKRRKVNPTKLDRLLQYRIHKWNFAQLQQYLEYKALWADMPFIEIFPKGTSRTCPRCHFEDSANRHGDRFQCKQCGYAQNADYIGARNIAVFGLHKLPDLLQRIIEKQRKRAKKESANKIDGSEEKENSQ